MRYGLKSHTAYFYHPLFHPFHLLKQDTTCIIYLDFWRFVAYIFMQCVLFFASLMGSNPVISSMKPVRNDWFLFGFGTKNALFEYLNCILKTSLPICMVFVIRRNLTVYRCSFMSGKCFFSIIHTRHSGIQLPFPAQYDDLCNARVNEATQTNSTWLLYKNHR